MQLPSIDKINKVHGEMDAILVGRQSGWFALYHLVQLFENRVPLRIRKVTGGNFHERDAQRPDVAANVVTLGRSTLGIYSFRLNQTRN